MADDAAGGGLVLPIGFTEKQAAQQLARIEAEALKRAKGSERAWTNANTNIVRSTSQMSGQVRAQLQNTSYQLQDVLVQLSSGTSAAQALGQQAPQLLSGFGAMGAVLGLVAAAAIPLAANFLGASEEAEKLGEKVKNLETSLQDYYSAVEAANAPTAELIEKYGAAAGSAQRLLEQLAQIAKLDAIDKLNEASTGIADRFQSVADLLGTIDAEKALGLGDSGLVASAIDQLNTKFGLTVDQARELQSILNDQSTASTPQQAADAMLRMAEFMGRVNQETNYANAEMRDTNRLAAEGALASNQMMVAMEGAASAAESVTAAAAQMPGAIDAAAASAANLARQLSIAIGIQNSLAGRLGAPSLDRFGNGEDITRRLGGADLQEQQTFRYNWLAQLEAAEKAGRGGGGRKRGSGGGRKGKEERPFFENVERDLVNLTRQLELIGKTSEEVATAEARWAMLDEAKKRGITVNETLNGQIEAQAAQVGQLTAELERAEIAQQQFDEAVEGIADAFAGAIVAGESLREGLAQVFKQIASDILSSGIRNAISGQLQGQGGGILSGIGKLIGFASGGYTGQGGMHDPAGVVHRGEYVFSKRAVDRMGVDYLEALHNAGMRGYSSGGLVGAPCEGRAEVAF